jgi:ubiquinone/menaquinone biosynthesis C-methylase UbiE
MDAMTEEAQPRSVKRAQVEFHAFASLGEPERAMRVYAEENLRRQGLIEKHRAFIGAFTPFLEIGANAGHTSYMLANVFGAQGFALDLSADALRYGIALQQAWKMPAAPVRIAGDALRLPFRDGSLRFVMTFQTLSQFLNIEAVFREVERVLQPGGVFLFAEEPLKRFLTLGLYRCPYYDTMKPWERKLYEWGLLGYLVRDVIGAYQEESFGIRQNHTMGFYHWDALIRKYFEQCNYDIFVPDRGWGERLVRKLAPFRAPHLLGGTLAAVCRKSGLPPETTFHPAQFERVLACPDCGGGLLRDPEGTLRCQHCPYAAPDLEGVYNLLPTAEREELYPGVRDDIIDFSMPGHEKGLLEGWHELEGVFGNRYRWMGAAAGVRLRRLTPEPQRLRIRCHLQQNFFDAGKPRIRVLVNGQLLKEFHPTRTGLTILESDLPDASEYIVRLEAAPVWNTPQDGRPLTITVSMIRLVPRE